jgi:hypothetical protein
MFDEPFPHVNLKLSYGSQPRCASFRRMISGLKNEGKLDQATGKMKNAVERVIDKAKG